MDNNKIIKGLWIGKRLSTMEKLSISSFTKHGHEFHLYVYDNLEGVPQGTVLKDASNVVPQQMIFKDKKVEGTYANFSDIFRYKLLLEKGGYWADLDTICLQPFDFPAEYVFAQQNDYDGSRFVCCGVIKAAAGSEIMEYCYETSKQRSSGTYGWIDLGPRLLDDAVKKFNLTQYVVSYKTFIPIDWMDWKDIISGKLNVRIKLGLKLREKEVYAVHLWNCNWAMEQADKDIDYHPRCLYEKLKRRYLNSLT
jgi:hypothetical protein